MKSYLLEVLATNVFHRRHVILNTTQDMIKMGFRPESVRSVACFHKPVLKGFYLTSLPAIKGVIPGQQEIIDLYRNYPVLFNLRHHPVIGEIQEGIYAGEQIALFTQGEIRDHFSLDAIRLAIKRNVPHRNVRWRAANSYAEAQTYYCRADRQSILDIIRDRYTYSTLSLTECDHLIFRQQVKRIATELYAWMTMGARTDTPVRLRQLAGIYSGLTKTIRCEQHYLKLVDTLCLLRGMLVKGVMLTHQQILVRVNTLENIAAGR